ncbi:MAG: hypothetical protein E6K17_03855 [Methanobacteriota archaeon]|nr:MAG: hypothetical protein E6K17_03855 [Euryarchaeota archaeon]
MGAKRAKPASPRAHAGDGETNALATEAFRIAAKRMREAGFDVGGRIEVFMDPKLDVGGYSIRGEGDRFRIVASGMAVRSGLLDGLLLHEMSHIYRMRTNHPSHDSRIIEDVTNRVASGVVTEDYQRKMLHDLVNNVEDLYADDIAFPVMRKNGLLTVGQESELFLGWVEDRPAESRDATRVRWENAWSLANNARAIAEMERQDVPDTGGRAAALNDRLVSQMGPGARGHFDYFRSLLANLKDGITGNEYRALLIEYLGRFRDAAEPT